MLFAKVVFSDKILAVALEGRGEFVEIGSNLQFVFCCSFFFVHLENSPVALEGQVDFAKVGLSL